MPEGVKVGVGACLFWGGLFLFVHGTETTSDASVFFVAASVAMMFVGALLEEGFSQRGTISLLFSLAIGAIVGIAMGWFVGSGYAVHEDAARHGLSAGLYSGLATGFGSWLLLEVPRRLKARRTGPNSNH